MAYTAFKLCFLILHIHSEETVSQIFHVGLGIHFMPKSGNFYNFCTLCYLYFEVPYHQLY